MSGRAPWLRRLGPWLAIGTSPAAIMTGGGAGELLSGPLLLVALAVGIAVLVALAGAMGVLGQMRGAPMIDVLAGPLGERAGRPIAALVMLAMMIGWFGVNVGVAGEATGRLLGLPLGAGVAVFGAAALLIAARGLGVLSWSALAAGLATTGLAVYGLRIALEDRDVSLSSPLLDVEDGGVGLAVALLVGYGAAFALRTPDFTHDLGRPSHVAWCAAIGLAAPLTAFALAGVALQAATGRWNLADVLLDLDAPTLAYLFLAVGFLGSVLTNLHSGALSLTEVRRGPGQGVGLAVVATLGGVLAAVGFAEAMLDYLSLMAVVAPGAIVLAWMHRLRGARRAGGRTGAGLVAWGAGAAAGLALDVAGSVVALPVAVLVTAVVFWLLDRPAPLTDASKATAEDQVGDTAG